MRFKRIQFTPDLLPGDITGGYVYDRNENRFVLRPGPVFANVILADEINRASPRTQSALLEAMQEYQVTIEGETLPLEEPFIVIATQNPIEYEGTFPLPEAQLDRFIVRLSVGYPSADDEKRILARRQERRAEGIDLAAVTDSAGMLAMRAAVEQVHVEPDLEAYIVELVARTRTHRQVVVGASPRGALALLKLSRAWAALQGRAYVLPDDIKGFVPAALGHRLMLEPDLWTVKKAPGVILEEIMRNTPVPVIGERG
jgi:MoxR-like ATPase